MKQILSVSLLSVLIFYFAACSKEFKNPAGNSIEQWKWVHSTGGFSGNDTIKPSFNAAVVVTFNSNATYTTFLNNQQKSRGTYSFSRLQNMDTVIHFDNTLRIDGLFLRNDQVFDRTVNARLNMGDYNISEAYSHHFEKVK